MIYSPFPIGCACRKCGIWKPYHQLCKNKNRSDGVERFCLNCERIRSKEKPYNSLSACNKSKRWRDSHPEQYKEINRANVSRWQKNNPEKRHKTLRRYYVKHTETIKEKKRKSRQNNPQQLQTDRQRRLNRVQELPSSFTAAEWQRALQYFHGTCAYCGNPPQLWDRSYLLHQEHHIPIAPGYELDKPNPGYVAANIVPACQSCNLSKGNKSPDQWATGHFGRQKAKAILKRIHNYFEWVKGQ